MKEMYIARAAERSLDELLDHFPVVGLLGPRQCGKSTLAKRVCAKRTVVYLDLELPSDLNKLTDAEAFLRANQNRLVCLDEIQRIPELFPVLRALCDQTRQAGQYLVLSSSSPDLIQQSSESLAGRIAYLDLTTFLISENDTFDEQQLWLRGGFPDSYLAASDHMSFVWREQFIRTFLERDLAVYGFGASMSTMRRLWMMLAHCNGQLLNASKLASSLGVTSPTVRRYIDFLQQVFMLRVLSPWFANVKKRLVKSPKVLFGDTGLLHALLGLQEMNQLFGHPAYGSSWESYVITQLLGAITGWNSYFYRSAKGDEIDLLLQKGEQLVAIECKASTAPVLSSGFYRALDDLKVDRGYVVAPLPEAGDYPLNERVMVTTVRGMVERMTGIK